MSTKFSIIAISVIILAGLFALDNLTGKKQSEFNPFQNMAKQQTEKIIREPVAAGAFYPADPKELEANIRNFLNQDGQKSKMKTVGEAAEIFGLIAPHAGYDYSGGIAGFSYKEIEGKEFDTVVIMANSHREYFSGISVFPEGFFRTPLGEVAIDADFAKSLIEQNESISFKESAHQAEHAIEVHLPFLQIALKNNFKIVPILFGNSGGDDWRILADALGNVLRNTDKKVLIIASSDLSHYPKYEDAKRADQKTLNSILTGEVESFAKAISELENQVIANAATFVCGPDAIKTLLAVFKSIGGGEIKLLKYANSGDVEAGDESRVVGYGAVGFFRKTALSTSPGFVDELNKEEQAELLKIARDSVEAFVKTGQVPEYTNQIAQGPTLSKLKEKLGAFVTITKYGRLRGCIGVFSPAPEPLYKIVSQMAISAATQDNRFYPVGEKELPDLKYEISVLSELKKVDSWQEVELGKHGVEIKNGLNKGVFLPQVAGEAGWNKGEFLSHLCSDKAGLPADCYQDPATEIFVFTAQVFGDSL